MASAKKKLDEYHLKILRQLVTAPPNKECFDCHQRGPTYVNVTIGSFVCTTCSGMLRGLTPPHRVKSISMATFTPDEIDFVKARGNDYCRRTWLGLLDTQQPSKDEQQIKDFMISKYERKRYYLDPAIASTIHKTTNGNSPLSTKSSSSESGNAVQSLPIAKAVHAVPPTTLAFKAPPAKSQPTNAKDGNVFTPEPFADFNNLSIPPPTDPFNSSQSAAVPSPSTTPSFADFENNPVFSNSSSTASLDVWADTSIFSPPVQFPQLWSQVPLRPISGRASCPPVNRWSIPSVGEAGTVPGEDRYAALKDLDFQMKAQQPAPEQANDWSAGVSTSATNVWPSQPVFPTVPVQTNDTSMQSNPFKDGGLWSNGSVGANPFWNTRPVSSTQEGIWSCTNGQMTNGFTTSQSLNFSTPKVPWKNEIVGNPFAAGSSPQSASHHSSNPFL